MSESDKPFTVSDRRHFTPDGRLRDDEELKAMPDASPERPPAPQSDRAAVAPAEPADFGEFVVSLGAQAGLLLSGQGLPEGAPPGEALESARSIISILEMLRDKTEGRRTPREDEILEGLLFELRMAYLNRSRTSGS